MEIACTEMASVVAGAERQREEHRVNEQNECTVTWDVPQLDVCKEEEVVSGGFTGHVCVLCGERVASPTHQTEHVDEVCCHLCQVKFSQKNLLALHLKNAHSKSRMLCTTCTVHMGQNLTKDQIVESNVIHNKTGLDDEMDEVVGRMNETEGNSITDSTEDNKTISLHDHSYVSSPTCRSIRETQNNVVLYTSSENVLVFVNETDKASPKSSYTESDQQRTAVDDRTVCSGIHDHDYFSIQNLANHMLAHKTLSSTNNVINSSNKDIDVCNSKAETTLSPKDPLCAQSDLDQIWKDELVCMGLLDHTYFFRPSLSNHTVLSKQVPSLQLECNNEQIQEDIVGGYEVIIQGSDHDDSDTLSADDLVYISDDELESDTDSSTSYTSYASCTDSNAGTLGKGCTSESWSACQKPNCENTNQKSPSPVHYKNPNPATNLNKDLQICSSCGLHKVHTEKSTEQSTCPCTQSFPCSLCEIVFGTEEMLLNHQEEKHNLAVCVCVSCLEEYPTQVTFMQHVCSKSEESLTPSNSSNNAKELAVMILDVVPSSAAAAESSKQAPSSPSVSIIDIAENKNPGTMLNSTSHSSPTSPCTSTTQKLPVQVMATGSSSCAQKVLTGSVSGDQGQDKSPIFTVNQKQIGQVQVLRPLPSKMVTQTRSPSSPILLSSQCQGQKSHQIGLVQVLSQLQAKVATQPPSPSSTTTQILSSQGRVKMPPTVTQKQFGQVQDISQLQVKVVTKTTASSTTTPTSTGATPILLSSQGQGQVPPISKFIQEQIRPVQVLSKLQAKVATQPPSPSSTTQILSSQGRVKMPPVFTVTQKQFGQVQDISQLQVKVVTKTTASSTTTRTSTPIVLSSQVQGQVPPISKFIQKQIGHVQVLSSLHPKVLSQPSSPFVSSTQILRSSHGQRKMPHQIGQVQVLGQLQAKVATQPPSPSSTTQIRSSRGRVKMPPISIVTQKQMQDLKTASSSSSSSTTTATTQILLSSQGHGQVPPISKFTQGQNRRLQVLRSLQPKVATQTPSPFVHNTQILHSSQDHRQMTPISTVTHMESKHVQDLTPLHTPTSSAKLPTSTVLPQHHPSFGIHLPHPFLSPVSNSVSVPSKTGQLSKSNVPLLDIRKSSPSTPISTSSQGPLKIVAMFMNQSRELALQKRMCQSWRSKAVFPCRQCGAVSRQFSLGVRHRYQHRGPRLHRCQCGRAFQQLMHLLRHQVQHAEATRYVCASCGQMFFGTQQLACHRPLFRITASNSKKQTNKKCRNTFQCYCGRSFMRPAALLWHMLKNPKDRKPHLKGFRIS